MQLQQAMDYIRQQAQALGADQWDAIASQSSSVGLNVFQGKVQQTEVSESMGLGVRVFRAGRPGYAFTERLTENALQQTLQDALAHCEFTETLSIALPPHPQEHSSQDLWNEALRQLDLSTMASTCLELEKKILDASSEIENIPHLGIGVSEDHSCFANSQGVLHLERANGFGLGVGAVGLRNGVRKMGMFHCGGRDFSPLCLDHMAQETVRRSLELLSPRPVQGGAYPVVLSHRVSAQLLGMFFSNFHAESIQKGQSRLAGRLGETIASSGFTLRVEPTRTDMAGARWMDGEGVLSQSFAVVENGVLQQLLYNLESAQKEGVPSTGNASRSYSGRVGTSFGNAVVLPGEKSEQELLHAFPRCLYIVKLEGGSGCSSVSGEISIGAQGFWVENGECLHAVDGMTLSSNFYDLLPQIVDLSNDYDESFSSLKVPALAVEQMQVST